MKRSFADLKNRKFDILIIGGGIYGAWTAYDASLRGLKVALVEGSDWAYGTSSASSKLIHGGLRYLEHFRFGLVRKSLRERELLTQLAPHRVTPLRFIIPVYKKQRVSRIRYTMGLAAYHMLTGKPLKELYPITLSVDELQDQDAFLQDQDMMGGFVYDDCLTDDARFTLEIVAGAYKAGAVVVNHTKAIKLIKSNHQIVGAVLQDNETKESIEINATYTVCTTGAWTNEVLKDVCPSPTRLTKGVHLVMPRLPTKHAFLLNSKSDGRFFFLIPWYNKTLLGTTDTDYTFKPQEAKITAHEVDYLLKEANRFIKGTQWEIDDIHGAFCGFRTFKASAKTKPSATTRNIFIKEPLKGLIYIIGGKFTSARFDATRIIDRIIAHTPITASRTSTHIHPLPWSPNIDFSAWMGKNIKEAKQLNLDEATAKNVLYRYGSSFQQLREILTRNPALSERISPDLPFCKAEILHAIENEMAITLDDILRRRIPLCILTRLPKQLIQDIAEFAAKNLQWSSKRLSHEIKSFEQQHYNNEIYRA